MKKYLVFALSGLSLISCVTFSRNMIKDDFSVIKKEKVSSIDGTYEFKGYEHLYSRKNKTADSTDFAKMLDLQNIGISGCDKVVIQSKALDKRKTYKLKFKLYEKDSLKYAFEYDAKLQKGLLILNNYTSKCHGIPFLLGGCRSFQSSIGLTSENNLLVHDYYDNSGAFLFIMWVGYTINYTEKYKRIQ